MIELKGKYNKDCKIFADDIEESAYSLIQNILDEKATKDVPVRIMPDVHAGVGIVIGFTCPMTKFVNPDWIGVDIGCFTGDTKIKLTDGRDLSFNELIEENNKGIKNYCYSINKSGNISISRVRNPSKTRITTELCYVTLDNDELIKCTPDHKFLMRDGTYKEAKDLSPNDSLMPLYIDIAKNVNVDHEYRSSLNNYLTVYNPRHDNYKFIHYLADEYNKRKGMLRTPKENSWVRHHIDFNKYNNNPNNVVRYGYVEHWKLHHDNIGILIKKGKFGGNYPEEIHPGLHSRAGSIGMSKNWENKDFRDRHNERQSKRCKDPYFTKRSLLARIVKVLDEIKLNNLEINEENYSRVKSQNKILRHHPSYKYAVKFSKDNCNLDISDLTLDSKFITNHKVKSIEIKEVPPINVYCLVNQEFNNFALSSGVFVHNCGVETHELSLSDDINLELIDSQIRDVIPMGLNLRSKSILNEKEFIKKFKRNVSSFHSKYTEHTGVNYDLPVINEKYITSTLKRLHMEPEVFYKSIGTLGGGNHFIELGKDLNGKIWLTIHSGSRNLGIKVWKYHTNQAKIQKDSNDPEYSKELEKIKNNTSDKSQIPKLIEELKDSLEMGVNKKFLRGEYLFNYLIDMIFAQTYAEFNRDAMRLEICKKLHCVVMDSVKSIHNYIDFDDFIIRKGAIRSYKNEMVVIPFSMKDGLIIGEGKSNEDFNYSASHGAGRVLARGKAKELLSMEEFKEKMKGIYSTSVVPETLDESPMAYKDPEIIEILLEPTVKVTNRVIPILNIKSID